MHLEMPDPLCYLTLLILWLRIFKSFIVRVQQHRIQLEFSPSFG